MKKTFLVIIAALSFWSAVGQTTNEWDHFYSDGTVKGFYDDGNYIWITTADNLVSLEKSSGVQNFYPMPLELKRCSDNGGISKIIGNGTGYIWLATNIGLYSFNGFSFSVYNPANALTSVLDITDLHFDSNGYLWMSTYGAGLLEFDGTNWNIYDTTNSCLPKNFIPVFAIDNNNDKWIDTYSPGILKFDGVSCTVYDTSNTPLNFLYLYNIASDNLGNIWVALSTSDTSIFKFDGSNWQNIPFNIPGYYSISSFAFDGVGNIYAGTFGRGLLIYNGATWTLDTLFKSVSHSKYIYNISVDTSGNIWALSCSINLIQNHYYILKNNGTSWQGYVVKQNAVLASNVLLPLIVDDNNNLWVGDAGWDEGGVNKFDGTTWSTFISPEGYTQQIFALAKDTGDIIWVGGTEGGIGGNIYTFDGTNWIFKDTSAIFNSIRGDVSAIVIDQNHDIWATTGALHIDGSAYGYGLYEYNGASWSHFPSGLTNYAGTCLAIDASNNKWMGTNGSGLAMYNGSNWISYDHSNSGMPDDTVQCVAIDSLGRIWVGTFHGLAIYDGTTWTTYTPSNSPLTAEDIEYIAFDHQGLAYITCNGGYVTFDGTTWNVYDMNNSPISNNDVESVAIDQQCNVWLATECGLDENIGNCAVTSKQISGTIYQSSGVPFANTRVDLLRYNPVSNSLNVIEVTTTDISGHYNFYTIDSSVYVHTLPSNSFPNELPVYQNSYLVQQDATLIHLSVGSPVTKNLTCQALVNVSGSGSIDGVIHLPNGTVVKGLRIFLMNGSSQPVGTFITDNYGYFAFINLPIGAYSIWVDKLGVDNSLFSGITLTSSSQNQNNIYLILNATYLSIATGIEENVFQSGLNIFPNPTNSSLTISFSSSEKQIVELRIYNTLGEVQLFQSFRTLEKVFSTEINVKKWSDGIYFLQVKMKEGNLSRKVIVNH